MKITAKAKVNGRTFDIVSINVKTGVIWFSVTGNLENIDHSHINSFEEFVIEEG